MITLTRDEPMDKSISTMALQIAEAARTFEQVRTGHGPKSVTVAQSEGTLVITLHGALSQAERALARTPTGATLLQYFHRRLFTHSADTLRCEIKRITGVGVREPVAAVETKSDPAVHEFTSDTMVQVFLLAHKIPADTWSGSGTVEQS
jgi:uncharacterized protein YbcI